MAAIQTVAQRPALRKPGTETTPKPDPTNTPEPITPKHGVVTLFGYGINIRVNRGHLILEDGIADERREGRFPRVGHGLERLVVIGNDGVVSLAALRWLADQNTAFVMLERDGSVLLTTGPVRPSDARLRRAQACVDESGTALKIARELIGQKVAGQEQISREILRNPIMAGDIAAFGAGLPESADIAAVRQLEAMAAKVYWSAWQNVPVVFPKSDLPRVPEHWRTFGSRQSPLTGSPRHAANPANAILNYLYTILEAEARLALAAMGLDPGLGFIHMDGTIRDSLACDLMEPIRPQVDRYLLDWITRKPLKREWFFEQRDGNCRLMASIAAQLAETASSWRSAVAPWAEWIASALWSSSPKSARKPNLATRLTKQHHREAKGRPPLPAFDAQPETETFCRACGVAIRSGAIYCKACAVIDSTERVKQVAPAGWAATQSATAQALRSETKKRHDAAKKAWDPASHPAWLTEEAYREKVRPLLMGISTSRVATVLGVTWAYAQDIRKGHKLPHPRHWLKLAELVGVSEEE
jgi:CRISPR-associated endonuclease Cas1